MPDEFFTDVPGRIGFGGVGSTDPLNYAVYEPDRLVLGKRMADHLRIAVCLWHSFDWHGRDVFGSGTFDRPWLDPAADPMAAARRRWPSRSSSSRSSACRTTASTTATSHRRAPRSPNSGTTSTRSSTTHSGHQERTGAQLLWGTANLFSHPRYPGGAATNPDPEVFAYAAAQVRHMLEATHRLGGTNYVLWGGREGYDTLLNTDLQREVASSPGSFTSSPSTSTRSVSRARC